MSIKQKELVTLYKVNGRQVLYRRASVYRSGGNGRVLQDQKSGDFFEVAYNPNQARQDFQIVIETQYNEDATIRRAGELWTLFAYGRLSLKVARLVRDLSSDKGVEMTYNDIFFEADPSSFRDYWLKELTSMPAAPNIINATGEPITEGLRPFAR
jgi:hypothetical protein